MSTASAIPAVIDALVASFTAAMPPETVFDGYGLTEAEPEQYVIVGCQDADSDVIDEAASSTQGWAWLGHVARDELIQVKCVAVGWNGDADIQAARNNAFGALKMITDAIENDPSLGVNASTWVTGITSTVLRQAQSAMGATATLSFDIEVRSRLT